MSRSGPSSSSTSSTSSSWAPRQTLYDSLLFIYATPPGIVLEWLLGAAVLYHALNGLRIIVMDFWPRIDPLPPASSGTSTGSLFALVGIPVT